MTSGTDHALRTYEDWAGCYDDFTAHHDYEAWTATIEAAARVAGLTGRRLLDVACGTGKSFLPFLARGYEVVACDLSPAMARIAAGKAGDRARVEVHDMRELPRLGAFDLVTCLDDAVNYLLSGDELAAALRGMAGNLAPGGVLVFDTNTLATLRTAFSAIDVVTGPGRVAIFEGLGSPSLAPGGVTEARLELLADRGGWIRRATRHRQRHHPDAEVRRAVAAAALEPAFVGGFTPAGRLSEPLDEAGHSKALYIARASAPEAGEGR